jgi:hypothetical protein
MSIDVLLLQALRVECFLSSRPRQNREHQETLAQSWLDRLPTRQ